MDMEMKHILKIASVVSAMALACVSCQKEAYTVAGDAEGSPAAAEADGCALNFIPRAASLCHPGGASVKASLVNEDGSEPDLNPSCTFNVAAWEVASDGGLTPAIGPFETVKYVTGTTSAPVNAWVTVDGSDNVIEHRWKSKVDSMLFYACSNVSPSDVTVDGADTDSPVLKVSCSVASQTDILMGYYLGDGKTEVVTGSGTQSMKTGTASVQFSHPLAAVAFEIGTISAPADSFKIDGITLEGIYTSGTAGMGTDGSISWSGCSGEGSLSQSVSTTPTSGQVGEPFLVIPQTFSSDSARVEISARLGTKPVKLYIRLNGDTLTAGTITKYSINYDAHKGIQLWEGGPYWASCNIGATYPEEFGWFFSWGNDEGFVPKDLTTPPAGTGQYIYQCSWTSVKDGHVLPEGFTAQYYMNTPGYNGCYNHDIDESHDTATKLLGAGWRMPTREELSKLISSDYTVCREVSINGVHYGYMFTGKGDYANRSVFLPSAGHGEGNQYGRGSYAGFYWSKSYYSYERAYSLQWSRAPGYLMSVSVSTDVRAFGRTIRPVENF